MKSRLATFASLAVVVAAGLAGALALSGVFARRAPAVTAAPSEPPQTVATVVARRLDWQQQLHEVGNLRAEQGADLAFETAGIVSALSIASGQEVREGTVLARLRLDDEPARLAQLKANADLASVNLARDLKQFAAQAVSHAIVDQDRATLLADQAQVAAEQAMIDEKTLAAPFAGRLGIRQVDLGQYLQPGTKVVTLQALDPIDVDFYVPQQAIGQVARGHAVVVTIDAFPGRRFAGRVTAVTPEIDQASRTVLVRARLANTDHALLPGMFAAVEVDDGAPVARLTLPQSAIAYAPYGDTVFKVVGGVARQVAVTTGATRGDQVAVLSGLAPGDVVVSAGQVKLHDGTPVAINNAVEPGMSPDPNPPEE